MRGYQTRSIGPVRVGWTTWKGPKQRFTTVVAKITLSFDGSVVEGDPDEVVPKDVHVGDNPLASLRDATDLVPYLPRGEVLVVGSVPATAERSAVRIALARGATPLLEKTFAIEPARGAAVVPLTYDSLLGGPSQPFNPVGRPDPLITNARDPSQPLMLGPVAPAWRAREALLRPVDRAGLSSGNLELTDGFPWEFFHAAPPDLRLEGSFQGDEVLIMKNLGTSQTVLRLPGVRFKARVYDGSTSRADTPLVADMLRIDAARRRVTLTARAALPELEGSREIAVLVGAELTGRPLAFPSDPTAEPASSSVPRSNPRGPNITETVELSRDALGATLPFQGQPAARAASGAPSTTPRGAQPPWKGVSHAPVVPAGVNQLETLGDDSYFPAPAVRPFAAAPAVAAATPAIAQSLDQAPAAASPPSVKAAASSVDGRTAAAAAPPPPPEPDIPPLVIPPEPEYPPGSSEARAVALWKAGMPRENALALLAALKGKP